ncbi:protein PF3D7_1417600 isoform X2 [Condylostylus longicornis]|uniref:protein PF3D7_1417600 isoform X2 n=1 Tax=Condylostylus longicornis TaxID=2530218 RepID=UPI00244DE91C|nr:protein PF3D7_1417600 isoform X2 [Condylostylus longicornis]
MYGYSREAIRVKVKKCEMNCQPEWRKFSVDPQITSVEILHSILAKAFDIRSDFSIFYKTLDPLGHETFLAVMSDWDLDAAFLRTHNYSVQTGSEPCLNLRVDVKSFEESNNSERSSFEAYKLEHSSFQQSIDAGQKYVQNMQNKLPGLIMNQMEKTFSMVQRALNFAEEQIPVYPPRAPLSDSEFRSFLDSVGQIIRPQDLRHVVFLGGIDPSLRKVVWKHILNVYPNGMTGRERMDYIKRKASEYLQMREVWKSAVQSGSLDNELAYVTSMVKKDVLRTDRLHQFYAGSDDNQNISSLFNILTTFALNHPKVSYCQGMSDLASPLLVTMNDEAHAYICFCAIMERLKANFMLDGIAMTLKFSHLTEALQYYDIEFYNYLKLQQADDLLFCYRWLLLELKREFPFEDSLRMLEVQWSSLRSDPPDKELKLFDKEYTPQTEVKPCKHNSLNSMEVQRKQRENHYANICALRRQTSASSLYSNHSLNQINLYNLNEDTNGTKLDNFKRLNHSLDENITRIPLKHANLMKAHQSLDETKMLLLMRNISPTEYSSDTFNNLVTANDKKTIKNQSCDMKNYENKKVIFHSTNPFINDVKGGSTEILICDDKMEQEKVNFIQPNLECTNLNKNLNLNYADESNKGNSFGKPDSISTSQIMTKHKGHFKELKEKITASKKGISASTDKIETQLDLKNVPINQNITKEEAYQQHCDKYNTEKNQKVVKNLNEFLNFANKTKTPNKPIQNCPKIHNSNLIEEKSSNYINMTKQELSVSELDLEDKFQIIENNVNQIKDKQEYGLQRKSSNSEIKINGKMQDIYDTLPKEDKLGIENAKKDNQRTDFNINYERLDKNMNLERNIDIKGNINKRKNASSGNNTDVYVWENPLHQISKNSICSLSGVDISENEFKHNIKYLENNKNEACQTNVNKLVLKEAVNKQKILSYKSNSDINVEKTKIESLSLNPFLSDQLHESKLSIAKNLKIQDSNGISEIYKKKIEDVLCTNDEKNATDKIVLNSLSNKNFKIADSYSNILSDFDLEENSDQCPVKVNQRSNFLPPPNEFGGGNPFLIFLCLTLLLQHRNIIMRNNLDYNEMAMHFDKMVRKHDVNRVLNQARRMYFEYLKTYNALANAATATESLKKNSNNLEKS